MTVLTHPAEPAAAVPAPRRLLGRHDFRLLWIGESTSALGSCVTSVALPLVAVTTLHTGVIAASLLTAAAWLPWLLIGLPAGAWMDRVRRRPVMLGCDVVSLALFASVPLAAWSGVLTLAQLLAVALLTGSAKVFFSTAYRALIPVLLEPADLVRGNSTLQGSESAAQVVGPGLGGLLAQAFGAANGLLADAASFVVSLVCLLRLRVEEQPVARDESRTLREDIAEGLAFVARDRLLRFLIVNGAAGNLALTAYNAIVVVFLVDEIGLSPASAGVLLAAGSLGGVAGALLAPTLARRLGSARALVLIRVGSGPLALLIPLTGHGWHLAFFVVGTVSMVGCVVAGNVVSSGFVQGYCPLGLFARVSTCMSFVNFGSIPVGAVLGGLLADSIGFRPALAVIFLGLMANQLVVLASPLRGLRDLPTHAGPSD